MNPLSLPVPTPAVDPEIAHYWAATAEERLVVPRCTLCKTFIWYPRAFCPNCTSSAIEWVQMSGRGTVYSFAVVRRGAVGPYQDAEPYIIAYVELEEGPRVMTNIVGVNPDDLLVGEPVRAVFASTGAGVSLVRFRRP